MPHCRVLWFFLNKLLLTQKMLSKKRKRKKKCTLLAHETAKGMGNDIPRILKLYLSGGSTYTPSTNNHCIPVRGKP